MSRKIVPVTVTLLDGPQTFQVQRLKVRQQVRVQVAMRRALLGDAKTAADLPSNFEDVKEEEALRIFKNADLDSLIDTKMQTIALSVVDENARPRFTVDDLDDWEQADINVLFDAISKVNNATGSKVDAAKN
jgi:hypothetical protein